MKQITVIFMLIALVSCSGDGSYKKAEDAQDAGRQFIRASLDGDYKKARFYLLSDEDNLLLFQKQQENYQQLTQEEKNRYRKAAIRPIEIKPVSDSVTHYTYHQSSNPTDTTTIRIIRRNGEWLVDLKSIIKM